MSKELKITIGIIFLVYVAYGFFALDIPSVNSDELWEASRGYYFKNHLHNADPLMPVEVSPFFGSVQSMGWVSWFIGTIKNASIACTMSWAPVDLWQAVRLNTFFWSIVVCVCTYFLGIKLGLNRQAALLSTALVVLMPEFFLQIHRERPEIIICAAYTTGLLLFLKAQASTNKIQKRIWLFITGLYAWLPAMLVHPSAIIIPPVIGILFLMDEWKRIFSVNTFIIGFGLAGGLLLFYFVIKSIGASAVSEGGNDLFAHRGPPIFVHGWMQFLRAPGVFYNSFTNANPVARPVSFLAFTCALIFSAFQKKNKVLVEKRAFYFVAICIPLLVLIFFSGSSGSYNVIVLPVVAIILSLMIQAALEKTTEGKTVAMPWLIAALLLVVFSTNFIGIKKNYMLTKAYKNALTEIKSVVPGEASVLGIAAYYSPFKDQHYYSASVFSRYGGRSDQSFEDAVEKLHVNYIILDDALVSLVTLGKGEQWTDSMFSFLDTKAQLVREIKTTTSVGKMLLDPKKFPAQWNYGGMEKSIVKRIKIFRVTNT